MSEQPLPNWNLLIPELSRWADANKRTFTVDDWLMTFAKPTEAIAYSTLFWPKFVEYEGCLLWYNADPENFKEWMDSLNNNKTLIEKVINHRHPTDLFLNSEFDNDEQVSYLGKLLQEIWTLKLKNDFPRLNVQVSFYWDDPEAYDDAQITVYCQRD